MNDSRFQMVNPVQSVRESKYDVLMPILRDCGATCSPVEFYWAVNDAFHAAEAAIYDSVHVAMYEEEDKVWEKLFSFMPVIPDRLKVLDIGCGTGLVGSMLCRFSRSRVGELHLLDPSSDMLAKARKASTSWGFEVHFHHGTIDSLTRETHFDLITINSVLHHVVELDEFLIRAASMLRTGGVLLTAQDPSGSALNDPTLAQRRERIKQEIRKRTALGARISRRLKREICEKLGIGEKSPLCEETNRRLFEKHVIRKQLSQKQIWAVTDFHVPGQPYGLGSGLTKHQMEEAMKCMKLERWFTYNFHGMPWTDLSANAKAEELRWWREGDPHGALFATVWRKNG